MRSVMLLSAALIVIASSVALATPTAPPMGPPQNGRGHNGSNGSVNAQVTIVNAGKPQR